MMSEMSDERENRIAIYNHYRAIVDEQLSRTSGRAARKLKRLRVKLASKIVGRVSSDQAK